MKPAEDMPYARPNAAAARLLEIAKGIDAGLTQGRIYVEVINAEFLAAGGNPDEYRAGIEQLKLDGLIDMHDSGTFFTFTQKGT